MLICSQESDCHDSQTCLPVSGDQKGRKACHEVLYPAQIMKTQSCYLRFAVPLVCHLKNVTSKNVSADTIPAIARKVKAVSQACIIDSSVDVNASPERIVPTTGYLLGWLQHSLSRGSNLLLFRYLSRISLPPQVLNTCYSYLEWFSWRPCQVKANDNKSRDGCEKHERCIDGKV